MSTTIGSNNPLGALFNTNTANTAAAPVSNSTPNTQMRTDSVNIANYNTAPAEAGGWKKFSNSFGEMFSNIADKLKIGETYNLVSQEFNQADRDRSGKMNVTEFNVATLNVFDFWGSEFARADQNRDGSVNVSEYVDYRKEQLSNAFDMKDTSNDKHLNSNEIGFIGRQLLANRDPRVDPNNDGMINKREFTRSIVRGSMNIRDLLGI